MKKPKPSINDTARLPPANRFTNLRIVDDSKRMPSHESIIQPESTEVQQVDPNQLAFATRLDDLMLRSMLVSRGVNVGPLTSQTRQLYVNRLARLLSERNNNNNNFKPTSSSMYLY
jgi:hypothetical protein